MVVVFFVILTFIFGCAVSYFIERKDKNALAAKREINILSLPKLLNMLPPGVFLQPSFTWSSIQESGKVTLGVHPVLIGLMGGSEEVETRHLGEHVKKGETLCKLKKDSKELHIKSPVTGTIASVNADLRLSSWENLGKTWVYHIKPENISSDISNWFIGEKSGQWLREAFQHIKTFFTQNLSQKQIGLTMADGGELPVGVLSKFDKKIWQDFEDSFLL